MKNYLLDNYTLSKCEIMQSLFVSEFGLRHWDCSKKQTSCKWGHRIISVIELCPVIGLIATIIEGLVARYININEPLSHTNLPMNYDFLFRGNQVGCNGSVEIGKAGSIVERLQAFNPFGILFNSRKITSELLGGTCSAMSLEFIDLYFSQRKDCCGRLEMLRDRLAELGKNFSTSSEEMRNRQAAYNTIEVRPECRQNSGMDHSLNKVQALANYHLLKINRCLPEIDVDKLEKEGKFSEELKKLGDGVFFIRILKPADNEKLEEDGHSLVYVRERGLGFFYDPNYGLRDLPSAEHSRILLEGFKICHQYFGVSRASFYRVQKFVL